MTLGVTVGKFNPFHVGHDHLIATAKAQVDELVVLIGVRTDETVPAAVRATWIREAHPDVDVVEVNDDIPLAPEPWARRTLEVLGRRPDVAFTSEDYGDAWAAAMGARHVCVDLDRRVNPVTARMLRADLSSHWDLLMPPAKAYFAKRVCVVGVESSGTTTMARDLAERFETVWVPEYGRMYWEGRRYLDTEWSTSEFVHIAKAQVALEDGLARQARRVVICDTDVLATSVWHRRYTGQQSDEVLRIAQRRRYDLYFLTMPDFGFVQDGSRDGEHIRLRMHDWFVEALEDVGAKYETLDGPHEHRVEQAENAIKKVLVFPQLR